MRAAEVTPLVSCLMITRDRLGLAKRSIQYFTTQTYARRELVIVSEGDRAYSRALEQYLDCRGIDNARLVTVEPGLPLGQLRNISLDAATGEVVCQWDDDDCYHPDRVLRQVEQMTRTGARACFLTDNLQLIEPDGRMFWLDWTLFAGEEDTEGLRLFPPTVMMIKDDRFRYPETGQRARIGEDEHIAAALLREVSVAMLSGMGWLYLYVFHGKNTCSNEHHCRLAAYRSVSNERVEAHAAQIRQAVQHYPVSRSVLMFGNRGPVFCLS